MQGLEVQAACQYRAALGKPPTTQGLCQAEVGASPNPTTTTTKSPRRCPKGCRGPTFRGAPTYLLPDPYTAILQVVKLRSREGTSRKLPGSACLHLFVHARCALQDPALPESNRQGGRARPGGGSAAGSRACVLTRVQTRTQAFVDPSDHPRGGADPGPSYPTMPTQCLEPLIFARRPPASSASLHSELRIQPLIFAWSTPTPVRPHFARWLHGRQVEPEASSFLWPPRSHGPTLCLGAPHLHAPPSPPDTPAGPDLLVVAANADATAAATQSGARPVAPPGPRSATPRDPRLRRCRGSERPGPPSAEMAEHFRVGRAKEGRFRVWGCPSASGKSRTYSRGTGK